MPLETNCRNLDTTNNIIRLQLHEHVHELIPHLPCPFFSERMHSGVAGVTRDRHCPEIKEKLIKSTV